MKYMICWNDRPKGTPIEYENVQKRIPAGIHSFWLCGKHTGGIGQTGEVSP